MSRDLLFLLKHDFQDGPGAEAIGNYLSQAHGLGVRSEGTFDE